MSAREPVMSQSQTHPHYTKAEEIASSLSHALGIVLGIAGLAVLAAFAALHGGAWRIVSVSIYGATLILLFTASTLYHAVPNPRAKPVLRLLDHSAIFLLIAGTYTPFALISLRGPWGWSLFAIVWTLAIIGIALELRHVRNRVAAALLYLGMGWVGVRTSSLAACGCCWAVGFVTRSAYLSTFGSGFPTTTPCGICSCSRAVCCSSSRSCFTSCLKTDPGRSSVSVLAG